MSKGKKAKKLKQKVKFTKFRKKITTWRLGKRNGIVRNRREKRGI